MAAVIKLKRGTSTPSTSDIASGEVAVDTSAQKLYINDSGTVKEIGGGGGGGVTSDNQKNTVAGTQAGDSFSGTDAIENTMFGYDAGTAVTTGDRNTFLGFDSGKAFTTGYLNVAIGYQAGNAATTLPHSTFVGAQAGKGCTDGNDGFGYQSAGGAGGGATSYGNTGLGKFSLSRITSGGHNTAAGQYSGSYISTGYNNVTIGEFAAAGLTTGHSNTILGCDAGYNDNSSPLTTGDNNILIGSHAMPSSQTVDNEITLGDTNITKFRIPGLNFTVKDTTATEDYVLTVDANGEAGWEAAAGGGLSNIVEDTSPQLGGALDGQNNNMSNIGTIDGSNLQLDFGSVA